MNSLPSNRKKEMPLTVETNKLWNTARPLVTIIVPNFNRIAEMKRAIKSLCNLSYHNFETIIVDDGSTAPLSNLYQDFLLNVPFPLLIILKKNGGVHTARNLGLTYSRGKFCIFLDSDDELTPKSIDNFLDEYQNIPPKERQIFFEIKARCVNEKGNMIGKPFPNDVNRMPPKQKRSYLAHFHGELLGFRSTDILKRCPFPEPDDVTFVSENILWTRLQKEYKSWLSNRIVRIYHTETNNTLSKTTKKTLQHCINRYWNAATYLSAKTLRSNNFTSSFLTYGIFRLVLSLKHCIRPKTQYKLPKAISIMFIFCTPPLFLAALIYITKNKITE